jgi:hypothetical protein
LFLDFSLSIALLDTWPWKSYWHSPGSGKTTIDSREATPLKLETNPDTAKPLDHTLIVEQSDGEHAQASTFLDPDGL